MGELRVEKRGSKWQYRFEIAKSDGKRKRISKSGFKTKGEAIEAGTRAKAEYDSAGTIITNSEISVHDYLQFWLEQYCKTNLKSTTYEGYKKKIRLYIDPEIGMYKLSSISPSILQEFINKKFNEGFSRNTLASIKGILTNSFRYAVQPLRYIKSSPMEYVKLPLPSAEPQKPTRKKEKISISKEDFEKIIKRFSPDTSQYIPLQLGYRCGLRLGEVFGLDIITDFNEARHIITVNYQVQYDDNKKLWYLSNPKYNSVREIELDDFMYKILKERKEQMIKDKEYYGNLYKRYYIDENMCITEKYDENYKEYSPVNRRQDGSYCQPRIMQHCGRIVHYQLDMPLWDFHSLRHTHTTNLLSNGADIKYVQKRLGHKNIKTTLGIYQHITDEIKERNVQILNSL
ncbi:MAG: site-specific integrase [Clostridiales bacterium]|nr:site-specific integrase [Clostridiales bacterium]